jgi:hypothetical protein
MYMYIIFYTSNGEYQDLSLLCILALVIFIKNQNSCIRGSHVTEEGEETMPIHYGD